MFLPRSGVILQKTPTTPAGSDTRRDDEPQTAETFLMTCLGRL